MMIEIFWGIKRTRNVACFIFFISDRSSEHLYEMFALQISAWKRSRYNNATGVLEREKTPQRIEERSEQNWPTQWWIMRESTRRLYQSFDRCLDERLSFDGDVKLFSVQLELYMKSSALLISTRIVQCLRSQSNIQRLCGRSIFGRSICNYLLDLFFLISTLSLSSLFCVLAFRRSCLCHHKLKK